MSSVRIVGASGLNVLFSNITIYVGLPIHLIAESKLIVALRLADFDQRC